MNRNPKKESLEVGLPAFQNPEQRCGCHPLEVAIHTPNEWILMVF